MWNLYVACLVVGFVGSTYDQYDIRRPPTITKHPLASIIYRNGDSVTLECKANGIPGVSYEWEKNGQKLNPNQQNIDQGEDGAMTIIQRATSKDEGFYQCFATNQYGTAVSNTAHIQRALLDSTSASSTPLQKTVEEGKPFHLQADPRKSFPKPTYSWEMATDTVDRYPVRLRPSRRMQIAENGDLHFAYALPEDAVAGKLYKFMTFNHYLDVSAGASYTRLTLTKNPAGISQFGPAFGYASQEPTVAVIGRNVTLRCFFYGNPEPTISWTGPRNTLPIGRYTMNHFLTEFIINNITAADDGDYICKGLNTKGSTTHTLQMRVEAVPRFPTVKYGPRDVNVTEGESFTFNCNADAKPEASVVWFQDGQPLNDRNPPQRFVFSKDNKSLTIINVCRDCVDRERNTDLMVIQCNASNVNGYVFRSGYLNVLRRTVVTIRNETDVTVNISEGRLVEFDCRATSDPSTPPTVKWFKVEAEGDRLLYDEPPFLTVNAGLLTIQVAANATEIWPKYLGQYRCVADTGHSRVSQTVSIHEPYEYSWIWIWIGIGIAGILIILFCIICAVSRHMRNKRTERRDIPMKASSEVGIESADPLYDSIKYDDGVKRQSRNDYMVLADGLATSYSVLRLTE